MKKILTFLIFLLPCVCLAQFQGGVGGGSASSGEQPDVCVVPPLFCEEGQGNCFDGTFTIDDDYIETILPCPGGNLRYSTEVEFGCAAFAFPTSTLTYNINYDIFPAFGVEDLILPPIPTGFTATVTLPTGINPTISNLGGYSIVNTGTATGVISITYQLQVNSPNTAPQTAYNIDFEYTLSDIVPINSGVGIIGSTRIQGVGANITTGETGFLCENEVVRIGAPVGCSFDPNNKIAYPDGCGEENFISNQDSVLYHVNFQNTGTAPAKTVVIKDTLDFDFDLNTLKLLYATHDYTYTLNGNVLEVTFDNINLIDSTTSFAESIGWVGFQIKPKNQLQPGTRLDNTAHIYFDFNAPIVTNTTKHTIQEDSISTVSINESEVVFCNQSNLTLTASGADRYEWSTGSTDNNITVTQPGTYYVTGYYDYSCEISIDSVIIHPNGNIPVLYGNNVWRGYVYHKSNFTDLAGTVEETLSFDQDFIGSNTTYPTNGCSISTDKFSVRYYTKMSVEPGSYTFKVGGDDGYRLSLDGGTTWFIDNFRRHSYQESQDTYQVNVTDTLYMVLEYYDGGGRNRASFDYCKTGGTDINPIYGNDVWRGYVYHKSNFTDLAGTVEETLSFDQDFIGSNTTYPTNGCSISTDKFSVRYYTKMSVEPGSYTFKVGGDDGYRLSLDGGTTWFIDNFRRHSYQESQDIYQVNVTDTLYMVLEYYDGGGRNRVSFDYCKTGGTDINPIYGNDVWRGYVYHKSNFTDLAGTVEETLSFDQDFIGSNTTYPTNGCSISTDKFSVRYYTKMSVEPGSYTFKVGGDDGYRLSLDGGTTWFIDNFRRHSYQESQDIYQVNVTDTLYMVLEYYDGGGRNRILFDYELQRGNTMSKVVLSMSEAQLSDIVLYPNPSSAKENVYLSIPKSIEVLGCSVYSVIGQNIDCKLTQTDGKYKLSISSLQSGVYIVKLKTDKGEFVTRLVVL